MQKTCYINLCTGRELSNRNETKWSKTNFFAYLCPYKSPKGVTMKGNNNVHKTIWKNGKKEYEKYICCFFTIRNLKSAITYKCGRVVPFLISVYFAMSKPYCYFNILFMHHALYFPTFIFTLYVPCFSFFLIDRNQKQVLLIKWVICFLKFKNIYLLFSNFWKLSYSQNCFNVDQRYEIWRWK